MAANQTEEEQIASIKRWWETNGKFVVIGGIVIIASVIGTRTWQNFELAAMTKASAQYDLMIQELEAGEVDSVLQRGDAIIKSSPGLSYAILAAMLVAKVEVKEGNLDGAYQRLKWALEATESDDLKHIVRIRLAKILAAQGKLAEALTYATFPEKGAFASQYAIVEGDIYVKKDEAGSAKAAYTLALSDASLGTQLKSFVQVKLDDLGSNEVED